VKIYDRSLPAVEIQSRFKAEKQGLVARYDLDGNAEDLSGNGLNGTVVGTSSVSDRSGNPSGALKFDGFTDYIDLGNRPEFNFTRDFTVTAWIKLNGTQPAKYILAKYADFGGGIRSPQSYGLGTDDNCRVYAFVSGSDVAYTEAGGRNMSDGYWHAIAYSYSADHGITLYQDGAYVGGGSKLGLPAFTNSVPLMIGRASSGQWFNGSIDDVRIYSRSFSDSEIKNVYQNEFSELIAISPAVKLEFPTLAVKWYHLEFSTNLTSWAPLGDKFLSWNPTNVTRYVDAALNAQYYRLKAAPVELP
jgi:hypothetical protein